MNLYGRGLVDINFVNDVIDSRTDNPIYPPDIRNGFHYISDTPIREPYLAGQKTELYFTVGLYCIKGIPDSGAHTQPELGIPFETKTWDNLTTATTNAAGTMSFTHP